MLKGRHYPGIHPPGRAVLSVGRGEAWLWGWVLFSAVLHLGFVLGLWALPHVPARRASYPIYTVDLVGGEKIGGSRLLTNPVEAKAKSAEGEKAKAAKKELKTIPIVEKPVKKEKAAEKPLKAREAVEGLVLKRTKKEETPPPDVKKEVAEASQPERELPEQVREKLIQAALDRLKERTQPSAPSKTAGGGQAPPTTNLGEGQGAAALGAGGTGGGIVKGIEFVNYYNRMRQLIKQRWTWGGRRTDLVVTVRFGIQENGQIFGIRITRASGDSSYDDAVLRAVTRSNPLPPPPENYREDFRDVELEFHPKDFS